MLVSLLLLAGVRPVVAQTALDAYVAAPDTSYRYELVDTYQGNGYTSYQIDVTTLSWRSPTEILNGNEWQHTMRIVKPDVVQSNSALLQLRHTISPLEDAAEIATTTRSVVVDIDRVPNRGLQFAGDNEGSHEDPILAKSFRKFLDGGDAQWPALLPMVKSAVRAMDTTQEFMDGLGVPIENFVVTGHSKRGWTTWLTAAVDDRVTAIAPQAYDALNLDEQMVHHRRAYRSIASDKYGPYADWLRPYAKEGFLDDLDTPRGQELLELIDPYEYRERFDIPTYVVNSTGDEYFAPDSSQFYFQDLPGPKYLRYVPNTDHLLDRDAKQGVSAFYGAVLQGTPLPEYSWTVEEDGKKIVVHTTEVPKNARIRKSINLRSRDFRRQTAGAVWRSDLLDITDGHFVAEISQPHTGATAFMVEMEYDVGGNTMLFTTDISVVTAPLMAPEAMFTLVDDDGDGLGDKNTNRMSKLATSIGEVDTDTSNQLNRAIVKFVLPQDRDHGDRQLKDAVLRFFLSDIIGTPDGPLSVFHSSDDNDYESRSILSSAYEDASYSDTLLDLIRPGDAADAYYEVDVSEFVRADYRSDGDYPVSAFRLQVNEAVLLGNGEEGRYRLIMPGSEESRPQLVLTFVPEPTSLALAAIGTFWLAGYCGLWRRYS